MKNPLKRFGLLFGLVVLIIIFAEYNKKEPINWAKTYSSIGKNPFDLYVFEKEVDNLIDKENNEHWTTNQTPFVFFRDYFGIEYDDEYYDEYDEDFSETDVVIDSLTANNIEEIAPAITDKVEEISIDHTTDAEEATAEKSPINYVSINNFGYVDKSTGIYLNQFLDEGNMVMLIQEHFDPDFLSLYGIKLDSRYAEDYWDPESYYVLELANDKLSKQKFSISTDFNYSFAIADSVKNNVEILAYKTPKNGRKGISLIRVKDRKGDLILGLDPIIFTNYYLLKSNNHLFVESVIAYLPNQPTYFHQNEHRKEGESENETALRFIFSDDGLTWAWYFLIITLFVFCLFTAKRKQRIVPIKEPLKNTTVEFTKTVANLYIEAKDYNDLMHKSILYSLEQIRREHFMDTSLLDEKFCQILASKMNKPLADIEVFIHFIQLFKQKKINPTKENLIKLNQLTEKILH